MFTSRLSELLLMNRLGKGRHGSEKSIGKERSCTKHGTYTGPYCKECYEVAFGSDNSGKQSINSEGEIRDYSE